MRTLVLCAALLGCSLRTEAPALIDTYACNWELADADPIPLNEGYCWSVQDDWAAITPDWVESPCDVSEFTLHSVDPGTKIKVWVKTFQTNRKVVLGYEPGEDCR